MAALSRAPGQESALLEVIAALQEPLAAEPAPTDSASQVAAFSPSECPICRLVERSAERALRSLFAEFVNDPEVRVRFRKARGFCREHTPLLASSGDALGVSILFADLADETRRNWRAGTVRGTGVSFFRRPKAPAPASCPACAAEADAEKRYVDALAQGLRHAAGIWTTLEQHEGLCAFHVERVAEAAAPADAARLLEIESARMDALFSELEEFVRKCDYRFRGEPWGSERDAWRRALDRLRRR